MKKATFQFECKKMTRRSRFMLLRAAAAGFFFIKTIALSAILMEGTHDRGAKSEKKHN